jgi:alkanesulfonate monooxygenase
MTTFEFNWFLPTNGDGPHIANSGLPRAPHYTRDYRPPRVDYLSEVAQKAEKACFDGIMIPTASGFEDPWLVSALIARTTQRLQFLLTFRPGLEDPLHVANKIATLQEISNGRLKLLAVSGSSPFEQKALGDFLDHDARYGRTAEFLTVLRHLWAGKTTAHRGKHYRVGPQTRFAVETPPAVYTGGASPVAQQVAADHADTYLLWAEPPDMVHERIVSIRSLQINRPQTPPRPGAGRHARPPRRIRFGLRVHIIARDSEEAAWQRAEQLLQGISRETMSTAQRHLAAYESVGQQRQSAFSQAPTRFNNERARELEIYPNIWAGVGLIRGGAGTAIVGSYAQVAARMAEYHALGINVFVLSGYPNLEEAERVGAEVLPRLRALTAQS